MQLGFSFEIAGGGMSIMVQLGWIAPTRAAWKSWLFTPVLQKTVNGEKAVAARVGAQLLGVFAHFQVIDMDEMVRLQDAYAKKAGSSVRRRLLSSAH